MTKNQNYRPVWVIWILKFGQAVTRDTMGNGGCDLLPPGLLSGTKHLFDFSGIITCISASVFGSNHTMHSLILEGNCYQPYKFYSPTKL